MSGRKQHIIPQFFQRNFSIDNKILRHHKEKTIKLSIKDNWAERDYYSSPFNSYLDDKITEIEAKQIVITLNKILKMEPNKEFNIDDDIAFMLKHFLLRNKAINNLIKDKISDTISLAYSDDTLNNVFARVNAKYSRRMSKEHKVFLNNILNSSYSEVRNYFQKLINDNKTMHNMSIDHGSPKVISDMKYQIINTENQLILSDTLLSCFSPNGFSPIFDKDTYFIIFPFEKNKFLLFYETFPTFSLNNINDYLASCSYESFCSCSSCDIKDLDFLKNKIGTSYIYEYKIEFDKEEISNNLFNIIDHELTKIIKRK